MGMTRRVLVTGSRDWDDFELVNTELAHAWWGLGGDSKNRWSQPAMAASSVSGCSNHQQRVLGQSLQQPPPP